MIDYKKAWLDSEQIIRFLEEKINIEIKQHDKSRQEFLREIKSQADFYKNKIKYISKVQKSKRHEKK